MAAAPQLELIAVVAAPDRPAGRSGRMTAVPVASGARELEIPLVQPPRLRAPEAVSEIAALKPGFAVLADYGQIVPRSILDLPDHGILNVHPSLLPRHRGASPIPATIACGDLQAGVALMRMDEGLDTGPIVAIESWPLTGRETAETLEDEAARRGADLLRRVLDDWLAGRLAEQPQATTGVSVTRPLHRDDGRLDPRLDARDLERRVRAHVPWPGSFVDTPLGRLLVHQASVGPADPADRPGEVVIDGDGLALATADGRLRLDRVQLAGRRAMDGASLRRGAPGLIGQRVELR